MNPLHLFKNADNHEQYAAGATVFRKGDAGKYMYVIIDGEIDIVTDGKQIRTIGPGGIFGELSLIDDSPRSADAVAKSDCTLAPVDERRFLFLVHETPMFALNVMSIMAERLRSHT